jgi:hypothetical protein
MIQFFSFAGHAGTKLAPVHISNDRPFRFVAGFFFTPVDYFKVVHICLDYIVDPIPDRNKMTGT